MAKMNRERKLIERRQEKQIRKDARKRAAAEEPAPPGEPVTEDDASVSGPSTPVAT